MGTHVNGPCRLVEKDISLAEYLGKCLGFLFKILSVKKALSIQAHPDETLAKILRSRDPSHYPDDQPKPEMAIALTDFDVLCGFRPIFEILWFFDHIPPLKEAFKDVIHCVDPNINSSAWLKSLVSHALLMSPDTSLNHLKNIESFLVREKDLRPWKRIFYKVSSEYPGDCGVFFVFMLNHFTLTPGTAIFLPANEPHAYLSGGT